MHAHISATSAGTAMGVAGAHVLAFDCGGTTTRAAVSDRHGRVLGVGVAGPANYLVVGPAAARAALECAMHLAAMHAGLPTPAFAAAAIAMAGAGLGADQPALTALIEGLPAAGIVVDGDMVAALAGAFPDGSGVVVVAGTGSIAFGMAADGRRVQVGGWGHLLGDEGSGYAIGIGALRAILRAHDGRQAPTQLTPAILATLGIAAVPEVIERVYRRGLPRDEIAAFAPVVTRAAGRHDPTARGIVDRAGRDLAYLAATALRRLGLSGQAARVAPCGGLFQDPHGVGAPFRRHLARYRPQARVVAPALSPLGGAIVLALRAAGYPVDAAVRANLAHSCCDMAH